MLYNKLEAYLVKRIRAVRHKRYTVSKYHSIDFPLYTVNYIDNAVNVAGIRIID